MESFSDKVLLELIKTLLSISVLLFTWLLGQNILTYWENKKRIKEIDSDLANQFQHLYAEFKTITRLWKAQMVYMIADLKDPKEKQWNLLCRATDAEGKVETILMKLAMERQLDTTECETLGYFRQAYQQLRESLRTSKYIEASYDDALYKLFHELSTDVSSLITHRKNIKKVELSVATQNLQKIMQIRSTHWQERVKKYDEQTNENLSQN
jgi:hypothetical protein